jgi:hypothetical protein
LNPPLEKKKNALPKSKAFFFCVSGILLDVENLFAVVKAANFANAVILYECVASGVGTLVHTGHRELTVVGTSLVSACFGNFFLRNCHFAYTSLGLC